jgi:hypothetical protein
MRAVFRTGLSTVAGIAGLAAVPLVSQASAAPLTSTPGDEAAYVSQFSGVSQPRLNLVIKVPTITCTSKVTSPVYDTGSIFGTNSSSQYETALVTVTASCNGLTPSYTAKGVVDDSTSSSTVVVNPGDSINVALIATPTFETASFGDSTSGGGTFVDGIGFNATGAGVAVQGGGGSGFPKFTATKFSALELNGAALGASNPTAYDQVDALGKTEIKVGALSATGKAFTATFVASK